MIADALALAVAAAVGAGFVVMAHSDLRTQRVVVRHAKATTAVAMVGLGGLAIARGEWFVLMQAVVGAVLVTGIQLVPYLVQRRYGGQRIGRADVRLAIPFGWTLGWFGLAFAVLGFAVALLTGLGYGMASRRVRIPFVPFLTIGLWFGLIWAASVALAAGDTLG